MLIVLANTTGDPDTWPEAIAWSIMALAAMVCIVAWFKWGKASYNESERIRAEKLTEIARGHTWTSSTRTETKSPKPTEDDQ